MKNFILLFNRLKLARDFYLKKIKKVSDEKRKKNISDWRWC